MMIECSLNDVKKLNEFKYKNLKTKSIKFISSNHSFIIIRPFFQNFEYASNYWL